MSPRASLIVLAVVAGLGLAACSARNAAPDPQAIVDQAIAAHGGAVAKEYALNAQT